MKKTSIFVVALVSSLMGLISCNNDSNIGQSIVDDKIEIVQDSDFTISGQVVPTERVQSRTTSQLLGRIDAKGFGYLSSDVVTQFMPASKFVTENVKVEDIDSLVMYLWMSNGEFVGDSIVPMGMEVYALTKNLPSPIYSDFDPEEYYDASKPLASKIYNVSKVSNRLYADSVHSNGLEIRVKLPLELGRNIYKAYLDNPSNFLTPTAFADNVFKGVYIKNSFGSGRLMRTTSTNMLMYYHMTYFDEKAEKDTTVNKVGNYFAVTPEIVSNNDVTFELSDEVQARINRGDMIVMAPVGMEVKMQMPVPEMIAAYKNNTADLTVLNSVRLTIPADNVENECNFPVPTYVLMVLTKDKDKFFADNKLPDNITSFYATYNSATKTYSFGDMRAYLADLLEKDSISPDDYTFTIIPVSCVFETSSSGYYYTSTTQTLTLMTPYMASPVIANLLLDKAKIKMTYSTQTVEK